MGGLLTGNEHAFHQPLIASRNKHIARPVNCFETHPVQVVFARTTLSQPLSCLRCRAAQSNQMNAQRTLSRHMTFSHGQQLMAFKFLSFLDSHDVGG
jgi:hypothetical protein